MKENVMRHFFRIFFCCFGLAAAMPGFSADPVVEVYKNAN
jgi:hypothetical protein